MHFILRRGAAPVKREASGDRILQAPRVDLNGIRQAAT